MSHAATKWALKQRGLKPAAKIVLFYLCDHHNDELGCFPSQATLAEECEISRASLNNQLNELERRGLIRRVVAVDERTKRQRPTRYVLAFEDGGNDESRVQNLDGAVSRNQTRAVSKFDEKPCPKNDESRVQNLDTNPVRVTNKAKLGASERSVRVRATIIDALGIDGTGLTVTGRPIVMGLTAAEIEASLATWESHGLTDDQIGAAIKATIARQRAKEPGWLPRGVRYFDHAIADHAKRREQASTSQSDSLEAQRKRWASY